MEKTISSVGSRKPKNPKNKGSFNESRSVVSGKNEKKPAKENTVILKAKTVVLSKRVEKSAVKKETDAEKGARLNSKGVDFYEAKKFLNALKCWKEAAKFGCLKSYNNLGFVNCRVGKFKEGIDWYSNGAKKGCFDCLMALGRYYKEGIEKVLPKDLKKAYESFTRAFDLGSGDACYMVANCFQYGVGIGKNIDKAIEYYKKLEGYETKSVSPAIMPSGYNTLGVLYENEKKDMKKALFYYEKAVKLNSPEAFNNLGSFYIRAYQQSKKAEDFDKAMSYYQKSAGSGCVEGCKNLDKIYFQQKNRSAFNAFLLGAQKNDPECLFYVGACYQLGYVKGYMELDLAISYYQRAARLGNSDAIGILKTLGVPVAQDN